MPEEKFKQNKIHPQAIIGKNIILGKNNIIDAFVIIEDNTVIGENNHFHASCQIKKNTQIGNNNIFHSFCVIGDLPQDTSFQEKKTFVSILNNNVFREGVTVHRGSKTEKTIIYSHCYFMANSHIAHDCIIQENVIIANNSLLAGHVILHKNVFISGNCALHQFVRIGEGVMIGGLAKIVDDVPPYALVEGGRESTYRTINIIGLARKGVSKKEINLIKAYYNEFYKIKKPFLEKINTLQKKEKYQNNSYIEKINTFILGKTKRALIKKV